MLGFSILLVHFAVTVVAGIAVIVGVDVGTVRIGDNLDSVEIGFGLGLGLRAISRQILGLSIDLISWKKLMVHPDHPVYPHQDSNKISIVR